MDMFCKKMCKSTISEGSLLRTKFWTMWSTSLRRRLCRGTIWRRRKARRGRWVISIWASRTRAIRLSNFARWRWLGISRSMFAGLTIIKMCRGIRRWLMSKIRRGIRRIFFLICRMESRFSLTIRRGPGIARCFLTTRINLWRMCRRIWWITRGFSIWRWMWLIAAILILRRSFIKILFWLVGIRCCRSWSRDCRRKQMRLRRRMRRLRLLLTHWLWRGNSRRGSGGRFWRRWGRSKICGLGSRSMMSMDRVLLKRNVLEFFKFFVVLMIFSLEIWVFVGF